MKKYPLSAFPHSAFSCNTQPYLHVARYRMHVTCVFIGDMPCTCRIHWGCIVDAVGMQWGCSWGAVGLYWGYMLINSLIVNFRSRSLCTYCAFVGCTSCVRFCAFLCFCVCGCGGGCLWDTNPRHSDVNLQICRNMFNGLNHCATAATLKLAAFFFFEVFSQFIFKLFLLFSHMLPIVTVLKNFSCVYSAEKKRLIAC